MPARESSVQRPILAYLRTQRPAVEWRKIKGDAMGVAGDPDLFLSVNGRAVVIEIKRPGWVMPGDYWHTPQGRRITAWRNSGAIAAIVTSVAEVRAIVEDTLQDSAWADAGGVGAG